METLTSGSVRAWGCNSPGLLELVVSIAGETYWLWRAVDQYGFVLDVLVTPEKRR